MPPWIERRKKPYKIFENKNVENIQTIHSLYSLHNFAPENCQNSIETYKNSHCLPHNDVHWLDRHKPHRIHRLASTFVAAAAQPNVAGAAAVQTWHPGWPTTIEGTSWPEGAIGAGSFPGIAAAAIVEAFEAVAPG